MGPASSSAPVEGAPVRRRLEASKQGRGQRREARARAGGEGQPVLHHSGEKPCIQRAVHKTDTFCTCSSEENKSTTTEELRKDPTKKREEKQRRNSGLCGSGCADTLRFKSVTHVHTRDKDTRYAAIESG